MAAVGKQFRGGGFAHGGSLEEACGHSTVLNGRCVFCEVEINDDYGISFEYILPGLKYSDEEVDRMKRVNSKKLFRSRKLVLVLDLDHTLLHARSFHKLTSEEKLLETEGRSDICNINDQFLVKLRPYIRSFLEQANTMFEMYVCTMGTRYYASQVAKILDPEFKYFKSRIITREDFKQREKKNLNLVLGDESHIVILDDTESVWDEHKDNLIAVGSYNYFENKKELGHKSYSEKKSDESESDGALSNVIRVLTTIHELFFDPCDCRDVRSLLGRVRGVVLRGCTLLFNDGIENEESIMIWYRAEEMGATCTTILDSTVTHVVSSERETKNCEWGEKEKKFLVHPRWIHAAYYLWRRQPEQWYLPL